MMTLVTDTLPAPTTFAEAETVLAETLPGYESRPQQTRLAELVEASIATNTHALAQAGTGCGKSFATLIPAILSGRRTIVSTATKVLQSQLADRDVPFLQNHLGVDFTWALLKGRGNYFCANRASAADVEKAPQAAAWAVEVIEHARANPGFVGSQDEVERLLGPINFAAWAEVNSESDECSDLGCAKRGGCFAAEARAKAGEAQVVVVNHALLFTDLVVRNATGGEFSMLGEYEVVVLDEVHEARDYATSALEVRFTPNSIRSTVAQARRFARRVEADLDDEAAGVESGIIAVWDYLGQFKPGLRLREINFTQGADEFAILFDALVAMRKQFARLRSTHVSSLDEAVVKKHTVIQRRLSNTAAKFSKLVSADFTGPEAMVRWVEDSTKGRNTVRAIKAAPVTVAPFLAENLFAPNTVIGVSATMSIAGSFDKIAKALGVVDFTSLDVGSPFDYPSQARLFVPSPRDMTDPSPRNREVWGRQAIGVTEELINASGGRALLLFTSNADLNATYNALADKLPFTCFRQGEGAPAVLVEKFKADNSSVLFATRSFFQGVDIPGDALSLVIISKLPFGVPTDPMTEARSAEVEAAGGNSFSEISLPECILPLQQAAGRLIRSKGDRGVIAVLDNRLTTKSYGRLVRNSLPPATMVDSLDEVRAFFAQP